MTPDVPVRAEDYLWLVRSIVNRLMPANTRGLDRDELGDAEGGTLADRVIDLRAVDPADAVVAPDVAGWLSGAVGLLGDRDRVAVEQLLAGGGQRPLAEAWGVTASRVSQIQQAAVAVLVDRARADQEWM